MCRSAVFVIIATHLGGDSMSYSFVGGFRYEVSTASLSVHSAGERAQAEHHSVDRASALIMHLFLVTLNNGNSNLWEREDLC